MIMVALVFFVAGAIVAATGHNFEVLLVGRSLQGIGGGGLIALTEIVVTDLVPLRLRGKWFGIISATWAVGSTSGPVIGGALAHGNSWVRTTARKMLLTRDQLITLSEMDLLDQLALLRYCLYLRSSISETRFQSLPFHHPARSSRLVRLLSFHRIHNILSRPCDLGWRLISVDIVANAGTLMPWHRWPHHLRSLRGSRWC